VLKWIRPAAVSCAVLVVVFLAGVVACDGSSDGERSAGTGRFCRDATQLLGPLPEAYVGSAKQLDDVDRLISEAPSDVRADLTTFRDYLRDHVNPGEPDSQLTESWPRLARTAAIDVQTYIKDTCNGRDGSPPALTPSTAAFQDTRPKGLGGTITVTSN
jgi:hypothetical protein